MTDIISSSVGFSGGGTTPPQALEAERAVLAAIMLSEEAVAAAIEQIEPAAFYRNAHQKIFEAVLGLYNRNEKVDLITMAEELRKRGELELIGGPAALSQILEYAPAAANLEQHIRIVYSKAILRGLIKATSEIQQEAYAGSDETPAILDRAEAKIFAITDQRVREGFVPIRELLKPAFEHIQALFDRKLQVTGVTSGFADLDGKTSGFQNSDLIIVAGRPAMGKTSFSMNIAENAAIQGRVPVAIFSLEMSKEQLVQRLLCSQSGVALHRVRNGHLSNQDWPLLTTAAGLLQQAPIVIDDSPSVTLMEIRAKCRRLKSEGRLGMLVIDYLQLIRSSSPAENRVQEISAITRGLKALAKELNVPIIALSQLSRAVETRDKSGRPQLSDLRESGCLTADTRILRADTGAEVTMGELLESGERDIPVWTLDADLKMVRGTMSHVFPSGTKETFELKFTSGRTIKASANHPFLTLDGWRRLDQLEVGIRLAAAVPAALEQAALAVAGGMQGVPSGPRRGGVEAATPGVAWDTVASITPLGPQPVFDATVAGTHNFIANGIVVHNSIEQDSDLVLFVYREVVYKPDTEEPGKASIIIAKQRNGPTGEINLTFLNESTKFVPYYPTMRSESEQSGF